MKNPDFSKFSTKVQFEIESDGFLIKTANSEGDFAKTLKLRHLTFIEEGLGTQTESGFDFDSYDYIADHLIIYDLEKETTVGTYRVLASSFTDKFFSQTEFCLDEFLKVEGGKLELGRACIHPDYRNGRTVDLLWKGLAHYITECGVRYLFGCSSLPITDAPTIFSIMKALEKSGNVSREFDIKPTSEFSFPDSDKTYEDAGIYKGVTRTLPPLLRSYIHAGSKVHGYPAWDKDFKCSDMFTILDVRELNKKFQERYNPKSG